MPYIREQLLRKKAQEDAAKEVTSSTLKTIADSLHARLEVGMPRMLFQGGCINVHHVVDTAIQNRVTHHIMFSPTGHT